MQEKKNKRLVILLVVLLMAIVTTYWLEQSTVTNAIDKNLFRPADLNTIDEVRLQNGGTELRLTFRNNRWTLNDQYAADPSMIEVLFATLQQAEPKRPVPASQRDSIESFLRKSGVKVSLFAEGDVQKTFYAGGNANKTQAVFAPDGDGSPYVMTIPGYRVYVAGVFELDESGWRDKRIFSFNWRNFQQLESHFPEKPGEDFKVALQGQFFSIPGLAQVDTTRLNNFLDDVSLLAADDFIRSDKQLDSLAGTAPIVSITVKDVGGRQYSLSVFRPVGGRKNFPALVNETQWAIFRKEKIAGILRPKNFFGN